MVAESEAEPAVPFGEGARMPAAPDGELSDVRESPRDEQASTSARTSARLRAALAVSGWEAFLEWASMGRYGWHVWGSYAFCFLLLGGLAAHSRHKKRKALADLRRQRQ